MSNRNVVTSANRNVVLTAAGEALATAADAAAQRAALGAYSAAEVDALVAGAGSGATHGSGTLAERSALTPAAGDSFRVASGVATGDVYLYLGGAWRLVSWQREYADDTPSMLWSMSETSGTYASQGTHSVPLTAAGSIDRETTAYDGRPAVWCVGTDAQFAAGVAGTMGISTTPAALTLAAWARVRQTSGIKTLVVAQYGASTGNPYGNQLAIKNTNLRALIVKGGAFQEYTSSGTVSVSEDWQLLGWSYDGTTISYYVNGETAGTSTPSGGAALDLGSGSRWMVGSRGGDSEAFVGAIAGVRVYDSARPAAWWRAVYARGAGAYVGA